MELEKKKFEGLNVYEIIVLCLSLIVGTILTYFDLQNTIPFIIFGLAFQYLFIKFIIKLISYIVYKIRFNRLKRKEVRENEDK